METGSGNRSHSTTSNMTLRVDRKLKQQADSLFSELGLNTSAAITIFLRQSVREGKIPFTIGLERPNAETLEAMRECERLLHDPSAKGYTNLDEMWKDLEADEV